MIHWWTRTAVIKFTDYELNYRASILGNGRIFFLVNASGIHAAFCTLDIGILSCGVEWPGYEFDHSYVCNAEVNAWNWNLTYTSSVLKLMSYFYTTNPYWCYCRVIFISIPRTTRNKYEQIFMLRTCEGELWLSFSVTCTRITAV
jgi:hypothetical protein